MCGCNHIGSMYSPDEKKKFYFCIESLSCHSFILLVFTHCLHYGGGGFQDDVKTINLIFFSFGLKLWIFSCLMQLFRWKLVQRNSKWCILFMIFALIQSLIINCCLNLSSVIRIYIRLSKAYTFKYCNI